MVITNMNIENVLIGGLLGNAIGSNSVITEKINYNKQDQIVMIIDLPCDEVGKQFVDIFKNGVITSVEDGDEYKIREDRRCNIIYDEKDNIFKYAEHEEDMENGKWIIKLIPKHKYTYAKLTKLDKKTILTLKIYASNGERRFDADELILIFEKFIKNIINLENKNESLRPIPTL